MKLKTTRDGLLSPHNKVKKIQITICAVAAVHFVAVLVGLCVSSPLMDFYHAVNNCRSFKWKVEKWRVNDSLK